jgi:adenylyltransferase/sulfurtransferase
MGARCTDQEKAAETPETVSETPDSTPSLSPERYSRQVLFPSFGPEGQERLAKSRAVVIGCGGLGTVAAEMLARAGVGSLLVVDRDIVDATNLQRQVLFDEEDARRELPKAEAAGRKLRAINSEIAIETRVADVNPGDVEEIVAGADVVLDGLDNVETRFLLNDACVKHKIPWVYGAAIASAGLTMTILPGRTPCLRCLFESAPPTGTVATCETAGVLAPIVGLIASLEVAEALKILAGRLEAISPHLRTVDVWTGRMDSVDVSAFFQKGKCPACGQGRFDYLDEAWDARMTVAASVCGKGSVQVVPPPSRERFDFQGLAKRVQILGKASVDEFMLKFEAEGMRFTVFPDGRAVIMGLDDPARGRSLYAKYVGA